MNAHLKTVAGTCFVVALLLFGYGCMMSLTHGHEDAGARLIRQACVVAAVAPVLLLVVWWRSND